MTSADDVGYEGFRTAAGGWNPHVGTVYLATSSAHPGEVKLGATTLPLKTRLQKFRSKYKLPDMTAVFAMTVIKPATLEDMVQRRLRAYRRCGRTQGISNEWYVVDPEVAAALVVEVANASSTLVISIDLCGQNYPEVQAALAGS